MPFADTLSERVRQLCGIAIRARAQDADTADIAAGDLLERDRVSFMGHWFVLTHVAHYGSCVEVTANDGDGVVKVAYLPFESVTVGLPRPQPRRRRVA